MHLVRAIDQPQAALRGVHAGERVVGRQAAGAVGLNGPVDHAQRHVRHDHLDHRDLLARGLVALGVDALRGLQHQRARLIDQAARLGDALVPERALGQTDRAGR